MMIDQKKKRRLKIPKIKIAHKKSSNYVMESARVFSYSAVRLKFSLVWNKLKDLLNGAKVKEIDMLHEFRDKRVSLVFNDHRTTLILEIPNNVGDIFLFALGTKRSGYQLSNEVTLVAKCSSTYRPKSDDDILGLRLWHPNVNGISSEPSSDEIIKLKVHILWLLFSRDERGANRNPIYDVRRSKCRKYENTTRNFEF